MKKHCQRCGASSETTRIIEGLCGSCEEKERATKGQNDAFDAAVKTLMAAFYGSMQREGIENYIEVRGGCEDLPRAVIVTIRWADGLSPVEKYNKHLGELRNELERAEAERDALQAKLDPSTDTNTVDLITQGHPRAQAWAEALLAAADREQSASLQSLARQLQEVLTGLSDWHAEDLESK